MSNTNTKVLLVGGIGGAALAAKLLMDSLENEVNLLDEQPVEVYAMCRYPLEVPAMLNYKHNDSWAEMNKGKLSKRQRRK